jgi:glycosyltransferase involved in cell wall biosynthesis
MSAAYRKKIRLHEAALGSLMHKLSAIIPCKNERINIRDCIASVTQIADEIIVADNGSTDGTLEIVAEMGICRILKREFIGYSSFKNWAIGQATHDWILILDADERITPELASEIRTLLSGDPECDSYRVRRDNYFLGHHIRHCGWGDHKITRLLRRSVCRYNNRRVHEEVDVDTGKIGVLSNRLIHIAARDFESFMVKQLKYASLNGHDRFESGRKAGYFRTLWHAPFRFFYLYVVRRGFLDGQAGLMVCMTLAFYTFAKDAKIWELNQNRLALTRQRSGGLRESHSNPFLTEGMNNATLPPEARPPVAKLPAATLPVAELTAARPPMRKAA